VTGEPSDAVDPRAENPYEGVDIEELPDWWQDCLAEFEALGLYTYVPATFTDGRVVRTVIEELESEHDVPIKLLRVGGGPDDEWTVEVDDAAVGSVPWTRLRDGVSIVEVDSEEFERIVRSAGAVDG